MVCVTKRLLIILFLVSTVWAQEAFWAIDSVPKWVQLLKTPAVQANEVSERSVEWLLVSDQEMYDTTRHSFYHVAAHVNTTEGVGELADISIDVEAEYETVKIHFITIHRNGEIINALEAAKISELQREKDLENAIFTGVKTVHIVLADLRAGDMIEYGYTHTGQNPVYQNKYFGFKRLQWSVPVKQQYFRIVVAESRPFYYKLYNTELQMQKQVLKKEQMWSNEKYVEYSMMVNKAEATMHEDNVPGWHVSFAALQFTEMKDWLEVEKWAESLYQGNKDLPQELQDSVKAWQKGSVEEKIQKALYFVQNEVRYYGIEMGVNSHLPRAPKEVWSNRYGDCKDKSLLLSTMLQAMKIPAWSALVSTRMSKGLANLLPSPGAFNHVIVFVDTGKKQYWLDPTQTDQRGALELISNRNYGLAMVIGNSKKGLEPVPTLVREFPHIVHNQEFILSGYGDSVQLNVTSIVRYNKAEAVRSAMRNKESLKNSYVNYYSREYGGAVTRKESEFLEDADSNKIVVKEYYTLPNFFTQASPGRLEYHFSLDEIENYLSVPKIVERKYPYEMPYPFWGVENMIVRFPKDSTALSIKADSLIIEEDAYSMFIKDSFSDNVLTVQAHLIFKQDELLPEKTHDWVKHANTFYNELRMEYFYESPLYKEKDIDAFIESIVNYGKE
jgi:hypothetical protein